jgi:predicted DNA-binding transcriptional regulator YafY
MSPKRIQRVIKLLGLLQGGRRHNARSLAEACNVSRRTIFRDLDSLRAAEVPLVYDEERQIYSIPSQYFLAPTHFTADEALAVVVLCHELGDDERLPFLADARSAAVKIENTLPQNLRSRMRTVADAISIRLATLNPLAGQRDTFRCLLDAIADQRCVRIAYTSYSELEAFQTKLHPYRLAFHQHSWYLVGRSSLHAEVRTFNLGRIGSVEPLDEQFTFPRGFSLDRHFRNAWRMIPEPGPDRRVVARFSPLVARNVAEVKWHASQQQRFDDDGSLVFEVTVSGLREISWWLLGYGDQVEVLEPSELRQIIAHRVRNLCRMYAAESPPAGEAALRNDSLQ